jgi:Protein of unknown function (DUF3105)
MSQRRQDTRRTQQERRRDAKHQARATQRRSPAAVADKPKSAAPPPSAGFWTARNKWIAFGGAAAVVVALVAWWVISSVRAPLPGEKFPTAGNSHLSSIDDPHESEPYTSNPATSGPHLAPLPKAGIYVQPKRNEELGHFMEHGGVWVLYNCPDGCPEDVEQLTKIVNDANNRNRPVALAPFPTMDTKFAVVAWQYLLTLDELNTKEINNFIDRHQCRYNPEGGPYCSGVRGSVASNSQNRSMAPASATPFSVFGNQTPAPSTAPSSSP